MYPVAWFFLLHLHNIFCSKNPLPDFSQTVFTKKAPSVVWLLMQKQWSSGCTSRDQNCFQRINTNSFHAPREKGRVARAPTSTTVKSQVPARPNTKKKKEQTSATQAVQNSKAGQTRQRKDSSESTECLSKRRHPTKLGAKPKNRPELRRVSAKGDCSGSAIADIYISH